MRRLSSHIFRKRSPCRSRGLVSCRFLVLLTFKVCEAEIGEAERVDIESPANQLALWLNHGKLILSRILTVCLIFRDLGRSVAQPG
jgi:hypothetical protein